MKIIFIWLVSAISFTSSVVDKGWSSAILYTPEGMSSRSINSLIIKIKLSILQKERLFSKEYNSHGKPLETNLLSAFKFPLFPGP